MDLIQGVLDEVVGISFDAHCRHDKCQLWKENRSGHSAAADVRKRIGGPDLSLSVASIIYLVAFFD